MQDGYGRGSSHWLTRLGIVDKDEVDRLRKRFMKLDKVRFMISQEIPSTKHWLVL